mgnify:CR=1 FL=1
MADDQMRYGKEPDFLSRIGITGYERYYADMISFWREIYDANKLKSGESPWLIDFNTKVELLNFWIDFFPQNTNLQ